MLQYVGYFLYWSCLVKDLATMNHLSKLVTDTDELTIEDRVGCLVKLHQVLEMTLMLEQCLSLPHHLLCSAARSVLVPVVCCRLFYCCEVTV